MELIVISTLYLIEYEKMVKLVMKNKRKNKKILKFSIILIACILFLGISFFFGVQVYMVQFTKNYILNDASEAPVSDAVIVLGAFVHIAAEDQA